MTTDNRLALLIPAFNAGRCLPRLLRSAHAQTLPFDEIIVYDDCSTDDTAAVAREHGARVVEGEVNRGCSAGKNILARACTTAWMHFHDADDELKPDFVALARAWIEADRADVVLFSYDEYDDATGQHIATRRFDADAIERDARAYAIRTQINPFCGLYNKQAFFCASGYDEDPAVLYNEDVAFHIRLAFAGLRFAVEPAIAVINHRRPDSMSGANGLKCLQAHLAVMRRTLAHPAAEAYKPLIAERLWQVAGALGAHLDWENADLAAAIANSISRPTRNAGAPWFRAIAQFAPHLALRAREYAIRAFRPSDRRQRPRRATQ